MIATFTKRHVNPLDLRYDDIDIRDIAHAEALTNRFGGHTRWPINVAQHSVYVSRLVPEEFALEGLMHDASEAYLGDMTKWLKQTDCMAGFREAEDRAQWMIYSKYECCPIWTDFQRLGMSPEVEVADRLMVRIEALASYGPEMPLFKRAAYPLPSETEMNTVRRVANGRSWKPWPWKRSEESFLKRFYELTAK